MRLRVLIDVNKPLITGFWVPKEEERKVWAKLKYEKIADFCFNHGRLGHVMKNYGEELLDNKGEIGKMRYGLWIKAAPLRTEDCKGTEGQNDVKKL
ncbi:hypothetical protein DITRI_Ditri01bG0108300 [Diplodiscus trichospermus]